MSQNEHFSYYMTYSDFERQRVSPYTLRRDIAYKTSFSKFSVTLRIHQPITI